MQPIARQCPDTLRTYRFARTEDIPNRHLSLSDCYNTVVFLQDYTSNRRHRIHIPKPH